MFVASLGTFLRDLLTNVLANSLSKPLIALAVTAYFVWQANRMRWFRTRVLRQASGERRRRLAMVALYFGMFVAGGALTAGLTWVLQTYAPKRFTGEQQAFLDQVEVLINRGDKVRGAFYAEIVAAAGRGGQVNNERMSQALRGINEWRREVGAALTTPLVRRGATTNILAETSDLITDALQNLRELHRDPDKWWAD